MIPPTPVGSPFGSYTWTDWYEKVRRAINTATTIDWSQITSFTSGGILPKTFGGTGTATPALTAGTNISITGTWPANTIAFTGLLAVANGGTGTATPSIVAGTNIGVTGTWPNQTIAFSGTLPVANGGTGSASPTPVAGTNIQFSGTWPNQTISHSSWQREDYSGGTTLAASSVGHVCLVTSAGNITVPNSTFAQNDVIWVLAYAGACTLVQGAGLTMRLSNSASTGNRSLASMAFARIWFISASECVVDGAGVT